MSSRTEDLMEEMVKWLRFMGTQEARDVISDALSYDDKEKEEAAKIAYQLTNGKNTTRDIAEYIPFSYRWVSYRHSDWATLGIIEKESEQAPYKHLIPLDAIGIEYSEIPESNGTSQDTTKEKQSEESA